MGKGGGPRLGIAEAPPWRALRAKVGSRKMCLRKFKETEILPSMLSDHNDMRQEIINRRKMGILGICGN